MKATLKLISGVFKWQERTKVLVEQEPLIIDGFAPNMNGYIVSVKNQDQQGTFAVSDGKIVIPVDHRVLTEGRIYLTARKVVDGVPVNGYSAEPLTMTRLAAHSFVEPTFEDIFTILKDHEKRIKDVEDTQFGLLFDDQN